MRSDLAPTAVYELALMLATMRVPRLGKKWNALTMLSAMALRQRRIDNERLCN